MVFKSNIYCAASVSLGLLLCVCCCFCSPVEYKEDTTTAKLYKDRFLLKKENETVPINGTNVNRMHYKPVYKFGSRYNFESENPKSKFQVKAVLPGEKTMREGDDDDDDDDDDGGEYEGLASYSMAHPVDVGEGSHRKKPDTIKQESVPMMIIREVDMVAMEIPVSQKCKSGGDWSRWSPCSRPCGDGVQTRWRPRLGGDGVGQREQQVRRCHLADCDEDAFDDMFP